MSTSETSISDSCRLACRTNNHDDLKIKNIDLRILTGSVASSHHLPEDERDRIHVGLLQGLETGFVDGPIQNFRGHVPHSSLSGVQAFPSIPRLTGNKKYHVLYFTP